MAASLLGLTLPITFLLAIPSARYWTTKENIWTPSSILRLSRVQTCISPHGLLLCYSIDLAWIILLFVCRLSGCDDCWSVMYILLRCEEFLPESSTWIPAWSPFSCSISCETGQDIPRAIVPSFIPGLRRHSSYSWCTGRPPVFLQDWNGRSSFPQATP